MNRQVIFRSLCVAAFATSVAFAATLPPIIYTVTVNSTDTQMTITGSNFAPFGGNPQVQLGGGTFLVLASYGNSNIVADLPSGLTLGETYDVIVTQGTLVSSPFGVTLIAAGPAGPQGPQGPAGPAGPQGPAGSTGKTGSQGATGPAGPQGTQGPAGLVWEAGWRNATTYALGAAVSFGGSSYISLVANNVGNQPNTSTSDWGVLASEGSAGTNGNTVWNGATTPPTATGVNGDFYLDTATHCLYGPKASGAWPTTCVSVVGPTGATGAQGPQGATGSQGPQGSTGSQGAQGNSGTNGNTVWNGATTPPTATGVNGDFYLDTATHCLYGPKASGAWPTTCVSVVGPTGATGAQGPQGSTGSQGPQGTTGSQGAQGNAGTNGNTVWNGATTPPTATGVNGDFYLDTATHCLYGPKASGAWPTTCVSVVGPTGATGAQGPQGATGSQGPQGTTGSQGPQGNSGTNGNTVWNGATTPPSATGVNGDFYLDTATHCLYGPKASGAWPTTCVSVVGPTGATGSQGLQGSTGSQGPQGTPGAAGATGATGSQGPAGTNGNTVWNGTTTPATTTGVNGDFYLDTATHCLYGPKASGAWPTTCVSVVGPQGATGATGAQGPQGATGAQGSQGTPGATGATGATGSQGPAGTNGNTVWNGTTNPPPAATGVNGDFYLYTTTNCLYGPKVSGGAWPTTCATLVGPQGAAGPQGTIGATGATGATGPQGSPGTAGATGATGSQGPAGTNGTNGTNGNTLWNGTISPPPATTGANGDFYLNTTTNCLYGPMVSGAWPATCVTLVGPAGLVWRSAWSTATTYNLNDAVSYIGSSYISLVANNTNNEPDTSTSAWSLLSQQGVQGPAGQGSAGPAGPQGVQGVAGPAGSQGPQGNPGPQGPTGASGPPAILSGFCGTTFLLTANTGVLLELGSEDVSKSSCFNGYTASGVLGLPMPSAGNLMNLTVASNSDGSYSIAVIVYKNGVSTGIGCTITGPPGTCSDNGHTVGVIAGDTIAVQISGLPPVAGTLSIHASLEKQ